MSTVLARSQRHLVLATLLLVGAVPSDANAKKVRLIKHDVEWATDRRIRVAHLTDLHLGWLTPKRHLKQVIKFVRDQRPDVIVLTGDYVSSPRRLEQLTALLSQLPDVPRIATLGNHDHALGAAKIRRALESKGVKVLCNDSTQVAAGGGHLTIVGVDEGYSEKDIVRTAFRGVSSPADALVLTHDPTTAEKIGPAGAMVLSGHTHGGQIDLPVLSRIADRRYPTVAKYKAGWFKISGTKTFVNPGVGSHHVPRIGNTATPSVAIFDLIPRSDGS